MRTNSVVHLLIRCVLIWAFIGHAAAKEGEKVDVSLIDYLTPGVSLKFSVPVQFLSPRIADAVSNGSVQTDSLYLILKYVPTDGNTVLPASPRDLRQGTPNAVHIFVKLIRTPAHRDMGRWYLDRALKEELRQGRRVEPMRADDPGLLKYQLKKSLDEEGYSYVDDFSKTIFVRCWLRICQGYRTWRDTVAVEYRYGREMFKHLREIDSVIDRFLSETYIASR